MSISNSLLRFSAAEICECKLLSSETNNEPLVIEDLVAPDITTKEIQSRENANGGLTCQVCGIGFGSQDEFESVASQRDHFKSDWHRYNLQRSQSHRPVVDWEQFQLKIENNDVSSISGSESDSDQEGQPSASNLSEKSDQSMVPFVTKDGLCFRVWRCLLESSIADQLELEFESAFHELSELKSWSVILAKGGHFAAACFERLESKKQSKPGDQLFKIRVHKTLHRYVVRAKAGGRQSTKDASGKYAKSAGATLRRYNEAALERDIHEVLKAWKQELDSCDLIFISVSNSDKKAVFGGDKPCLSLHDPRIRNVPFLTRRPTFSEAQRVSSLLMATFSYSQIASESKRPEKLAVTELESHPASMIKEPIVEEAKQEAKFASLEEQEDTANKINKKKKKNKKRHKTKDQRRNQAMDTADKLPENDPGSEADDEDVEQAILEATKEFERMNSRRKEKTKPQKKEESVEERRKKLREAAEQRMALLKHASKSQGLW